MLQTHEATLHPDGTLAFRNDVPLKGTHRVLVTILEEAVAQVAPVTADRLPPGDVQRTLRLLNSPLFQERPYGSTADIEKTIKENRDAWDE